MDLRREMASDIARGLSRPAKMIPSKYFYDAAGSRLFEKICAAPEYYPTATEIAILDRAVYEIIDFFFEGGGDLVELGSGSNRKIRRILGALNLSERDRIRYVPVDISPAAIRESATELLDLFPTLEVHGIVADFTRHVERLPRSRKLILFLGSTIGNFAALESHCLLRKIAAAMGPEDRFLLGMDMVKPVSVLETAYNDRQGVTAEFNRNVLDHINRELEADFLPEHFDHWAFFNPDRSRVEMHLRARRSTRARLANLSLTVELREGETIHTEICRKFTYENARRMFAWAGLHSSRWFTDPRGWFSVVELRKTGSNGI